MDEPIQVQNRTSSQRNQDTSIDTRPRQMPVLDMFIYWRIDYVLSYDTNPLFRWFWWLEAVVFQLLCIIAFARTELSAIWENFHDPPAFSEMKEQINAQVTNSNIMAGLLLATTAVYLTTNTPREDMLRFSDSAPYALLLFSFGVAMGSILGGCTLQLIVKRCSSSFLTSLTSSRFRLACTLILIAYPLIAIYVSCIVCGIGLLVASITSSRGYVKTGGIFLVSLPALFFLIFVGLALSPTVETLKKNFSEVDPDSERELSGDASHIV